MIGMLIRLLFGENKHQHDKPEENDLNEPLQECQQNIEVSRYLELSNCQVFYSEDYSFRTPDEVLKYIAYKTIIWVDYKNYLLGFSNKKRTLLFKAANIKNFEIENILPARGNGCSYLAIRLLHEGRQIQLSISGPKDFDIYAEEIFNMTGIEVVFAPEYYDC
ncbi:hypothetical protein HNP38_002268 [Chryseobacterium defluvii]|uniref:Uncharacterized protein n=1 Tax=Chryseobacterium defluvii TaxID=160396 RepID=A0A840KJB4_9FLAO|nr:hypothetical protein [Chryseobacterium defluvii]MBB4806972.1 hypothetical protein [Chryseobacterium defluvii]